MSDSDDGSGEVNANAEDRAKPKRGKSPISPHINDIVSGRGSGSNRHEGNLYFRKLIRENKELYLSRPKNEKMLVARDIYHTIENLDPPGRFLQKNPETGSWFEIGKDRALEKISQALREKNSKLQGMPHQASPFGMGIPPQFHGFEQDRFNSMPRPSFASSGINRMGMAPPVNQGYGAGREGPPMGGFDMVGNDMIPGRTRPHTRNSNSFNSIVSDNMFERRIAELRAAREQMMRGRGGGAAGGSNPNDFIHQAQYQNSFLNSFDGGRHIESSLHAPGIGNRQSQSSWFQDSHSQPLPSLPEIPQSRFLNQPNHLFGNNANAGQSLLENERARVSRHNEYLNSLSSSQGLGFTSSQGGLPMMGNSFSGNFSPNQLRNNQAELGNNNRVPFTTPEEQFELNNLIMQRQRATSSSSAATAARYRHEDEMLSASDSRRDHRISKGRQKKRKKKHKNSQSKESTTDSSKRSKRRSSKSDVSTSSRSSFASSIEKTTSNEREPSVSHEDLSDDNKELGSKRAKRESRIDTSSSASKMPPLEASSSTEPDDSLSKRSSSEVEQSKNDEDGSRESSPTAGLDALSKAASLLRR